jgi:hypothetical protein
MWILRFMWARNRKSYFLRHGLKPDAAGVLAAGHRYRRFAEPDALYSRQAQERKEACWASLPITLTVLYAGKMTRVKNPSFVLDLAEACEDLPVSFVLVGDGI